jgi:hypothetical protein
MIFELPGCYPSGMDGIRNAIVVGEQQAGQALASRDLCG